MIILSAVKVQKSLSFVSVNFEDNIEPVGPLSIVVHVVTPDPDGRGGRLCKSQLHGKF